MVMTVRYQHSVFFFNSQVFDLSKTIPGHFDFKSSRFLNYFPLIIACKDPASGERCLAA